MRGHIVKRAKDSYSIVASIGTDPLTGKRIRHWESIKGTKKDAEKRLAEVLNHLDNGGFIKPSKTTFSEYLERWLAEYCSANLSARTVESYEGIVRKHLTPELGNVKLMLLKPEHLQKYYSQKLNEGLSPQTVRHHHTLIHKALENATQWGLVIRNVAEAVSPPRVRQREMQIWNENEVTAFLREAEKSPYYVLFYLALFTGMRRSELLALRWSDVDLLLCQLQVNKSLHVVRGGKVLISQTKSAKGKRMIALSPSVVAKLNKYREARNFDNIMMGSELTDEDFVFTDSKGHYLLPNTVTHAWIKLVRSSGVKRIRMHDARHTHASLMLKQGIHPKVVQERLGHASIQTTIDTYSHVTPGLQQAAALRFDEVVQAQYNRDSDIESTENMVAKR